ncbi:hypothetical protein H5410_015488 [Solanum commersonii]|uniref:Uncharacterized protein n=1 Tax=Solanum commersonii TaxID=4109 RepID=A0A9J5ZTZ6_SOLCO|nr:hypothetical protein H5410_015488 [Solanum commersonii]
MFNDRSNSSRRGSWKGRTQVQKVVPNLLEKLLEQQQLKVSTLDLLARTSNVHSPTFNMFPLFLGGALTESMEAILP